jgi:hypothetical protein
MNDDMYTISQIFLTPASILIGTFAIESSEPLKTAISIICLFVGGLWFICCRDALQPNDAMRKKYLIALPLMFSVMAIVFICVHGARWYAS